MNAPKKLKVVSQEVFDSERELRIRAEARVDQLLTMLAADAERHERELTLLLDHFKPADNPGFSEGKGGIDKVTVTQLLSVPAIGKRGLAARHRDIINTQLREAGDAETADAETRRASLSEEEQAIVDEQLNNAT